MTNFLVIDASLMIKLLLPNDQQTHIQQLIFEFLVF
jgi:predicted nucleic acid-binding protein